jgi:hypothetical protein
MTTPFDQYTLPEQPVASPVLRPRALFASPATVIGVRAAKCSVTAAGRTVSVWFYGDPVSGVTDRSLWALLGSPASPAVTVTADGTIVAAGTDADGNPIPAHLDLPIGTPSGALPARAPYRLKIDPSGLAGLGLQVDPLRVFAPVRLRPECDDAADCVTLPDRPPPLLPPDYDTLARDYAGLRAMLMERLAFLNAGADTSAADSTVTFVELMAHLGDLLNYRLDRVATEAWLGTARRRANVTRHARLVDYPVPPAISATAVVQVLVEHPDAGPNDASFAVLPADTATSAPGDPDAATYDAHFTLEPQAPTTVRASHAEVPLYDWTEADAVLSAGATSAVLVRPLAADGVAIGDWLPTGSLLAFEVVDPGTPSDHQDWARRVVPWPPAGDGQLRSALASHPAQVVTVTGTVEFSDPLSPGLPLVRVFWSEQDALRAPVPVSIDTSAGTPRVGVARLGLIAAHHGLCVDGPDALVPFEPLTSSRPDPAVTAVTDYWLTRAANVNLACAPGGRPWQLETSIKLPNSVVVAAPRVTSLLRAATAGFSVVVDFDDDDAPRLRFATGVVGRVPPAGSEVTVRYQVGAGPDGNIARDTVTRLVRNSAAPGRPCAWSDAGPGVRARNVTAGTGGVDPTPLDAVRRDAPAAYVAVPRRAVLISDLPRFAMQVAGVERAAASRSWSGSWPVGVVAVESMTDVADPALDAAVGTTLDAVRMAGIEVLAVPATAVGLLVALTVCLTPGTDVAASRLQILSVLRPGRPDAVFNPGAHPLGSAVYLSTVLAAVAAVPGVDAVQITEARRLSEPAGTLHSVITMGPAEMAVCDDDRSAPDRGRIELMIEGGR